MELLPLPPITCIYYLLALIANFLFNHELFALLCNGPVPILTTWLEVTGFRLDTIAQKCSSSIIKPREMEFTPKYLITRAIIYNLEKKSLLS